jgi:hypothetical protein
MFVQPSVNISFAKKRAAVTRDAVTHPSTHEGRVRKVACASRLLHEDTDLKERREQDVGLLMAVGLRFFLACLLAVVGLPLAQCTDPRSDAGCKFSWRALGCTPAAECKLQFKPWWGTLGPCKKRPAKSEAPKAEAPKKAPAAAAATPKKAAPAEPVKAAEPAAAEPEAKEAPAEEPAAVEEPKEEV